MSTILRCLLYGSDEQLMSKAWLADRDRMRAYESYTWRESQSRVVKDSAWFQRRDFWLAREKPVPMNVATFRRSQQR